MGKIDDYFEKHSIIIIFTFFIFIIASILLITMWNLHEGIEIEREQLAERIIFEGTVTEVIFDDSTLIVEFDNQTIVRMLMGNSFENEPISIDLWEEYQFTVNGLNYLVDYRIIEGDE